jgi:hypothetical protein
MNLQVVSFSISFAPAVVAALGGELRKERPVLSRCEEAGFLARCEEAETWPEFPWSGAFKWLCRLTPGCHPWRLAPRDWAQKPVLSKEAAVVA